MRNVWKGKKKVSEQNYIPINHCTNKRKKEGYLMQLKRNFNLVVNLCTIYDQIQLAFPFPRDEKVNLLQKK